MYGRASRSSDRLEALDNSYFRERLPPRRPSISASIYVPDILSKHSEGSLTTLEQKKRSVLPACLFYRKQGRILRCTAMSNGLPILHFTAS